MKDIQIIEERVQECRELMRWIMEDYEDILSLQSQLEQVTKERDEERERRIKSEESKRMLVEMDKYVTARFWSKVNVLKKKQCWEWVGYVDSTGYGKMSIDNYPHSAHVLSYKYFNGDYGKGLVIDHVCMNRKCVNPNHLRLVTRRINAIENSNSVSAVNHRKRECIKGHPFDDQNTRYKKNGDRVCRECERAYKRGKRARAQVTRRKDAVKHVD